MQAVIYHLLKAASVWLLEGLIEGVLLRCSLLPGSSISADDI